MVDFIAELAEVTDQKVDQETLFADPDDEPAELKRKPGRRLAGFGREQRYIKRDRADLPVQLSRLTNRKA